VKVENASAGSEHSFAWVGNEVYCWGSNKDYKLGFN
jgi:alpha-tubulin suppressor-like RCC1 family protein